MRLIDADELKEKLIRAQQQQINIINENAPRGSDKRHVMEIVHNLSFYEIIKLLDNTPTVTNHYDCNHDCDALYEAYDRGFSKGYLEGGADAYCKSNSNALCTAYNNGYSKGFSEGREEEKKEVMLLTDHCIGKCDILESVLHMEGDKND